MRLFPITPSTFIQAFPLWRFTWKMPLPSKALRGAGFGPQPAGARSPRAPDGWIFLVVAGRYGLRARPVRCGPGCGPGYVKKYAGRGGAGRMIQLRGGCGLNFFSSRSLSVCLHCLCLLVGEHFDNTVESTHNMSLFCCFALPVVVIH